MKATITQPKVKRALQGIAICLFLMFFILNTAKAQNGTPCYKPISGRGVGVTEVSSGTVCVNCTNVSNPQNVIDADQNNYSSYSTVNILAGNGVSVRDSFRTYPAGWHAGYLVSLENTVVSASVLSSITIETYYNGSLRETSTVSTGIGVSLLSDNSGQMYLSFPTTQAFNEVRFLFNAGVSGLGTLRIYAAMAFDAQCGLSDNNAICYDQMAGPSTSVLHNGGLTNALVSLSSAANITDGNKSTYATLNLPAGVSLLSTPPFVGVLEKELVHPAGRKAGFIIGYSSGLLSADVLNSLFLQTYLHGRLQETAGFGSGAGLLRVKALHDGSGDAKEVSFVTAQPFNEVRLVVAQPAVVNIGQLRIYYAFESGPSCAYETVLNNAQSGASSGAIEASRTGEFGTACVGQGLSNTNNVTSSLNTDYATFSPAILSVGCGASISVHNDGTDFPAGTFAGYTISRQSSIVDMGVLNAITINVYKDGNNTPVASATGAALLDLGLLNDDDSLTTIGFEPGVPFDELQIVFNSGLISANLGGTYRIHNAFIVRDSDGDSVPDAVDICGTGNDAIDTDGDGLPDACDACNAINSKSVYADTDGDGVRDACDADTDDDGIADASEDRNTNNNMGDDDVDYDGIANYLDLDSDNDGIPDLYESGIAISLIAGLDADQNSVIDLAIAHGFNGMANAAENNDNAGAGNNYSLADKDGDGVPDYVDLDSDNDGLNDIRESGNTAFTDGNGDGMVDGPDDDRDGIMVSADGNNIRGSGIALQPADSDNDGVPDFRDLDSDNDLISDLVEGAQPGYADTDNNGVADGADTDADGIVNSVDGNNGVFGDGNNTPYPDTDNDGVPDYRDPDKNNDGVNDIVDIGLGWNDIDGNGMVDNPSDPDGDGIPNNNGSDMAPGDFGGLSNATAIEAMVLLQGALAAPADTIMRDNLRQLSLIPVAQPYNGSLSPRFTQYGGNDNVATSAAILNANAGTNAAIVDWVLLEFRSAANPSSIVRTYSCLIRRDGRLVGADGNKMGVLLPAGNYYLSVKHRNHLGVMTSTPSVAAFGSAVVDFKHGITTAYGIDAMRAVGTGYYALHAGDINANGSVYYTAPGNDRDALATILGGDMFGYLSTYNQGDVNMDGETYMTAPGNDRDWLLSTPLQGNEFGYLEEQLPQ